MKRPVDVFSYRGRIYTPATIVADDDPIVTRNPDLFADVEPVPHAVYPSVERATARPGEKRAVKRPAKKAAPKSDSEG